MSRNFRPRVARSPPRNGLVRKTPRLQNRTWTLAAARFLSRLRALYLDPGFVLAHFDLGNLALRQGKPAEARKHSENALRLLRRQRPEELVLESEGITAGRLGELIESQMESEALP